MKVFYHILDQTSLERVVIYQTLTQSVDGDSYSKYKHCILKDEDDLKLSFSNYLKEEYGQDTTMDLIEKSISFC